MGVSPSNSVGATRLKSFLARRRSNCEARGLAERPSIRKQTPYLSAQACKPQACKPQTCKKPACKKPADQASPEPMPRQLFSAAKAPRVASGSASEAATPGIRG